MICRSCDHESPKNSRYCMRCHQPFFAGAFDSMRQMIEQDKQRPRPPSFMRSVLADLIRAFRDLPRAVWLALGIFVAVILLVKAGALALQSLRHLPPPAMPVYRVTSLPRRYLVSSLTELTLHSEHDGLLDTPIDHRSSEDVGRLQLDALTPSAAAQGARLSPLEWVTTQHILSKTFSDEYSEVAPPSDVSAPLPLNDASLGAVQIPFDARGAVTRFAGGGMRAAQAARLILPMFPRTGRIKAAQWIEPVAWQTVVGDWKVSWSGEMLWRLDGTVSCGDHVCTHLTFEGLLRPQVWARPAWCPAVPATGIKNGIFSGDALFDPTQGVLLENTLNWQGLLHARIDNLGRIPVNLRVGREVQGPGELVFEFKGRATAFDQR